MNAKLSQMILPLVILLSVVIKEGLSIECYSCNSFYDVRCNNPEKYEDANMKQDCDKLNTNATMCRKIEQHILIDGEEEIRIHRECATLGSLGDCLERTGTNKFKSWYCQCKDKDLCNSADSGSFSIVLTGAALSSLYFLRKLL